MQQGNTVEIPQGWQLRLCNAVLKPKSVSKGDKAATTVYIQVGEGDEASDEFALCQVDAAHMQCPCTLVLCDVDSPIQLTGSGPGAVHLTGCFERDPYGDDGGSEGDSEDGSEEEDSDDDMALEVDGMDSDDGEGDDNLGVFAELLDMVAPMGPTRAQMEQLAASYGVPAERMLQHLSPALDADGAPRVELLDDEEESAAAAAPPSKKRKAAPAAAAATEKAAAPAAAAAGAKPAAAPAAAPAPAAKPASKAAAKASAKAEKATAAAAAAAQAAAAQTAAAQAAADSAAAAEAAVEKPDAAIVAERRKQKKLEKKRAAEQEKAQLAQAFGEGDKGSSAAAAADAAAGGNTALKAPSERRMAGGLRVIDKVLGAGKVATPGKQVKVFYEGSFPDGRVFDKNYNRKSPLSFRVGLGDVIKGMDRGIEGMRVGGQRQLIIPSGLGYGKQGAGPIGPNQDLVFQIELLDVSGR